jgi:predicted CXXCH cytochrome family protein
MRARHWIALVSVAAAAVIVMSVAALAQSVVGSKHDLSTGWGDNSDACVYCHTPHGASTNLNVPLWNRKNDVTTFTPYASRSMDTQCPATPSAYSMACLSCHDGVNISGAMNSKHDLIVGPGGSVPDMTSYPSCAGCHPEYYTGGAPVRWFGSDLSKEHPISMTYPTAAQDPAFNLPPDLQNGWGPLSNDLRLYGGKVECPTCHNVHNPSVRPFLRKSNAADALCKTCHIK